MPGLRQSFAVFAGFLTELHGRMREAARRSPQIAILPSRARQALRPPLIRFDSSLITRRAVADARERIHSKYD